MSLFSVSDIEAVIRAELNEPSQKRVTSTDILNAINDGYKDVAALTGCVENEDTVLTTPGNRLISFTGHRVTKVIY